MVILTIIFIFIVFPIAILMAITDLVHTTYFIYKLIIGECKDASGRTVRLPHSHTVNNQRRKYLRFQDGYQGVCGADAGFKLSRFFQRKWGKSSGLHHEWGPFLFQGGSLSVLATSRSGTLLLRRDQADMAVS